MQTPKFTFNIFKVTQGFASTDKGVSVLNGVQFGNDYVTATNRYVAVRVPVASLPFVVDEPVVVPLDVVKDAARVKANLVEVKATSLVFDSGQVIPFEPVEGSYPDLSRIYDSFEPSKSPGPFGFNSEYLALFAKWFTAKERRETPLHIEFGSKGIMRVIVQSAEALIMPVRI